MAGVDMNAEEEVAKKIKKYLENRNIKIENAIFDKLIQVVLSEDIYVMSLEPTPTTNNQTIKITSGFQVMYEPYRLKKELEKRLMKTKEALSVAVEQRNSVISISDGGLMMRAKLDEEIKKILESK